MEELYLIAGKAIILSTGVAAAVFMVFYITVITMNMLLKLFRQWKIFVNFIWYRKEFTSWFKDGTKSNKIKRYL